MVNPWILVPLYIYPSGSAWQTLYNTISTNTGTTYRVIINPSSGPGGSAGSYPDANYIAGIAKLRSYKNTQLLGYVDTAYATRSYSAATSDIDTYAAWSKYSKSDIHMDGIFFDDNPNTDTAKLLTYMTNITTYARKKISGAHVSLNPGTTVSDKWYSMADSIVAFEDTFSDFSTTSINNIKSTQRSKSAFIIYNYSGTSANQQKLVSQLNSAGISGMFISTASGYGSFSRYWSAFTGYVASATSSTTSSTSNNVKVVNSKRDEAYMKTSSAHSSQATHSTHASHSSVSGTQSSQATRSTHASHSSVSGTHSKATKSASASHELDHKKVFKTVTSHIISKSTASVTHSVPKATVTGSHTGSHTVSHTSSHSQSTHTGVHTSSHSSVHPTHTSTHSSVSSTSSAHATHAKKWWPRAWGSNAQPIEAF